MLKADLTICQELTRACHILDVEGHTDVNHGQVSARSIEAGRFIIRGAAIGFDEVDETSFAKVDLNGSRIEGRVAIPPEWPIHGAIYRARPDVRAIVHSHPIDAIAFSATGAALKPISHDACPFMPELHIFDKTTNTITDWDTAELLAQGMSDGSGAILRNHGIVTAGPSIKRATILALMLNRACEIQLKVMSGLNLLTSSDADIKAKNDFIFGDVAVATYWSYYNRKVIKAGRSAEGGGVTDAGH